MTVATANVGQNDGVTTAPVFAEGSTVFCMIQGAKADSMMARFGVEVTVGMELLCNVPDAPLFTKGSRVVWIGRTFSVMAPPYVQNQGLPADYAMILLEEVRNDS